MRAKGDRPTKAALQHMGRIKSMQCICCELLNTQQDSDTDAHHIRVNGQARNDWLVLPLCHHSCHQGERGVHGDRGYLRQLKLTEWDLLAIIIERLVCQASGQR